MCQYSQYQFYNKIMYTEFGKLLTMFVVYNMALVASLIKDQRNLLLRTGTIIGAC